MSVDILNDELGLNIPESDEYESLAGYILDNTEDIPEEGAFLNIGPYSIKVIHLDSSRIDVVELTVQDHEEGLQS